MCQTAGSYIPATRSRKLREPASRATTRGAPRRRSPALITPSSPTADIASRSMRWWRSCARQATPCLRCIARPPRAGLPRSTAAEEEDDENTGEITLRPAASLPLCKNAYGPACIGTSTAGFIVPAWVVCGGLLAPLGAQPKLPHAGDVRPERGYDLTSSAGGRIRSGVLVLKLGSTMLMKQKLMATTATVAVVLAFMRASGPAAAGSEASTPGAYNDLPRVSAATPFLADCNGPKFPITAAYINAESEPYIAVNPRNPDNLIAVYHEDRYPNDGANGVLAATSFDGGRTWQVPELQGQPFFSRCAGGTEANGGNFEKASDPYVAFGPDGTAYFAAISWNASGPEEAQFVSTSADGGRTWRRPVAAIRASVSTLHTWCGPASALLLPPKRMAQLVSAAPPTAARPGARPPRSIRRPSE
jgi:hypothetical protein